MVSMGSCLRETVLQGLGLLASLAFMCIMLLVIGFVTYGLIHAFIIIITMFREWHTCSQEYTAEEEFQYNQWWLGLGPERLFYPLLGVNLAGAVLPFFVVAKLDVPQRESILYLALAFALLQAAARSAVVDWHFFKEPRAYGVYAVPHVCNSSAAPAVSNRTLTWRGQDGIAYCTEMREFNTSIANASYYIATARTEFAPSCSAFAADSSVLELWDCREWLGDPVCRATNLWGVEECTRLSWVLGWKFGMLLHWVAVLKILTDGLFFGVAVRDSSKTSVIAWTVALVLLELYYLALQLPAVVFFHGTCLRTTLPSLVTLEGVRNAVLVLGNATYLSLWILICAILLVVGGCLVVLGLALVMDPILCMLSALRSLALCCCSKCKRHKLCKALESETLSSQCFDRLLYVGRRCGAFCLFCAVSLWALGTLIMLLVACPYGCLTLLLILQLPAQDAEAMQIGVVMASNLLIKFPVVAVVLWCSQTQCRGPSLPARRVELTDLTDSHIIPTVEVRTRITTAPPAQEIGSRHESEQSCSGVGAI